MDTVAARMLLRTVGGRLIAMKRRTIVAPIAQLEGEIGEAVLGGERYGPGAYVRIAQGNCFAIERQHREGSTSLDSPVEAQRGESLAQRLRAQPAITPLSTLSEPDRKPRRSMATREKPAERTASRMAARRLGSSHSPSSR